MRLIVEQVAVARGGRRVVEAADFALSGGDVASLEGPNGSGKSTLLRAIAGFLPRDAGDVVIERDGGRVAASEDLEAVQTAIAYAGHLDGVKAMLNVAENLAFWARYYGEADADVDAALARFGLDAMADAPAAACSAGQRRRLGLARLAVTRRAIWLLDEPTTSLDAASIETFAALLAEHAAAGGIVLAATHAPLGLEPSVRLDMTSFRRASSVAAAQTTDPFLDPAWEREA